MMYGYGLLDVVELTELAERDREPREPSEVAALYYGLSEHLGIDLALTSVSALERGDRWHALARLALRDDLYGSLRAITLDALREAAPGTPVPEAIEQWERANASRLVRARAALHEVGTGRAARPGHALGGLAASCAGWRASGLLRHPGAAALDRPGRLPPPQPRPRGDPAGGGPHRPVLRPRRRGRACAGSPPGCSWPS